MPDGSPVVGASIATFGELLRYLRQRARLTQQELGAAVGYSYAQIARLEGGQRLPAPQLVKARFIEALGLQHEPELARRLVELAAATRMPADAATAPNNLLVPLTGFIGRRRELAELKRLLPATRLLTLTGAGGVGKTRLALRLAADLVDANPNVYPDGVWLVDMAPVSDPAFVLRAIAAVLGVREAPDRPLITTLLEALHGKQLLLLLDNCEHLLDACAHFADAALNSSEGIRVLATSRQALGIAGELTWRVPSLQTPDASETIDLAELARYESVRLFVDRARFALPAFALASANGPAVQQIVHRLDGIPLAIELAAARVKMLAPEQIAERLSDCFHLLTGGSRNALLRHQTLRGTIDWSYNLLTEAERMLLQRLTVFAGGWTLEACEAVCTDESCGVLDALTRLVDKSLVVAQLDESGGVTRYRLLETIRQYALLRLTDPGESARLRDRHLDYFVKLWQAVWPQMEGAVYSEQQNLVKRLERDLDNVHSALEWAIETRRIDDGARLTEAFFFMWIVRAAQSELLEWCQRLLGQLPPGDKSAARALTLMHIAGLQRREGNLELAAAAAEQALEGGAELDEPLTQAHLYAVLAAINEERGQLAQARSYLEKWRAFTNDRNVYDEKERSYKSSELFGYLALHEGDYIQAQTLLTCRYEWAVATGNKLASSAIGRMLGYALLYQGEIAQAGERFRESLVDNAAMGDRLAVSACLAASAAHALARGDLRQSARLFGASEALSKAIQSPVQQWDAFLMRPSLAALREQLDEATLNAAWAEGRAMTYQQAIDTALALAQ